MNATKQEKHQVEEILHRVSAALELDGEEARKLLHRYVCAGKCNWYETRRDPADFQMGGLSDQQMTIVREAISGILPDSSPEQAWYVIHGVLCPGHPRSHPKLPQRMIQ